jgi:HD superfamily phosphohydrolase
VSESVEHNENAGCARRTAADEILGISAVEIANLLLPDECNCRKRHLVRPLWSSNDCLGAKRMSLEFVQEFRCPIHGFIKVTELERDVINSSVFQRLRRIRQLAWTDYVYPGAMHTRFEHSLGVMNIADRLLQTVAANDGDILRTEYRFVEGQIDRWRQVVRLAALVHDIGHGPFSHASEEIFPKKASGEQWQHEDYSRVALEVELSDLINAHQSALSWGIHADDIAAIFLSAARQPIELVWKNIITGQIDADRMDYLLRDSYHCGVKYGFYDLDRLASEIRLVEDPEVGGHSLGITEDGVHAAEGLLIARYMMFTQVYYHKTRIIYDYHLTECLKELLPDSVFPLPQQDTIRDFLKWDDWCVLGHLSVGQGGDHGRYLRDREHFRRVFETPEVPTTDDLERFDEAMRALSALDPVGRDAKKSWYKFQDEQIRVRSSGVQRFRTKPLSELSSVVRGLAPVNQRRIYVPLANRIKARRIVEGLHVAQPA